MKHNKDPYESWQEVVTKQERNEKRCKYYLIALAIIYASTTIYSIAIGLLP